MFVLPCGPRPPSSIQGGGGPYRGDATRRGRRPPPRSAALTQRWPGLGQGALHALPALASESIARNKLKHSAGPRGQLANGLADGLAARPRESKTRPPGRPSRA